MKTIRRETLEQIIAANDIVAVIGHHIDLKKEGEIFRAQCPFHLGAPLDFHVDPRTQTYKCHGCGCGGSVVRFVMDFYHLDFISALRRLAARIGIQIEPGAVPEHLPESQEPTDWLKNISLNGPGIALQAWRQASPGTKLPKASLGGLSLIWNRPLETRVFTTSKDDEAHIEQLVGLLRSLLELLERSRRS